jgi:probable DNA repair protein
MLSSELLAAIETGAWVLTTNQRSAHWLKLHYANHSLAQGRTAWATPSIYSFNAFALQLWREQAVGTERVLSVQQSQLLWERVVAASEWSALLLSPQSAANTAFRSWERLQYWQVDRSAVVEHAVANDEARALLEWSDRFQELCRRRSWLPEALVPQRLLGVRIAPRMTQVVTTSPDLLPVHRAVLDHLGNCGVECKQLAAPASAAKVKIASCDSPERELEAAAEWARAQLAEGMRSIAVVIPKLNERAADVRRVFAEQFAQSTRTFTANEAPLADRALQESSFAIASYRALADFPVVRAALDLLQLSVGRASSALVGALLRNPFLYASVSEGSSRALADARLRGKAREHYDLAAFERLAAVANCAEIHRCGVEARRLRSSAPARALPSATAEQFIALWRAFGWPGEQSLNSDEQQIVARLQACLAEFGALDELLGPLSFVAAVREFEQLARNTSFEPRSLPAPINIMDPQTAADLQVEALWVAGMDETQWPPAATPDPFIPIALQVRANMPNATAQLARERARGQFAALQGAAAHVVFSWARKDEDVEILPSPWLSEFEARVDAMPSADTYAGRIFASKPTLATQIEKSAPPLQHARARGGSRIFELQSLCPFRAFAELRLGAQPLDAVVPSVDARERGTLIHAALADVWDRLADSATLQSMSVEQLTAEIRTALARHAAKLLDGASLHRVRMLQIEQELAAERILALLELDKLRAPFRMVGRPETQEQATVGKLSFELRLDRMDEVLNRTSSGDSTNPRVIIDYKTGDNVSAQSWFRERPEQPQLPLYAVTHPESLAAVAFAKLSAKGVAYQGVARDEGVLPGVQAFNGKSLPPPYTEWQELIDYWRSVIERLAEQFITGDARVDPLPTACRYCHLSTLCRVHEQTTVVDEDEDSP